MSYVYLENINEPHGSTARFTVGFYQPDGAWNPESDWRTSEEAARRVNYLNGGGGLPQRATLSEREAAGAHGCAAESLYRDDPNVF